MGAFAIAAWAFLGLAASLLGSGVLVAYSDSSREQALGHAFSAYLQLDLADLQRDTAAACERAERNLEDARNAERYARPELVRELNRVAEPSSWFFRETAGGVDALLVSGAAATLPVSAQLLSRALDTPTLFGADAELLVSACRAELLGESLWLVRTRELRALAQRWDRAARDMGLVLEMDAGQGQEAARLSDGAGHALRHYRVSALRTGLAPLLLRALAAALLVAALCADLARRAARSQRALENDVLGTLEAAATRIGQGDLSATITRNVGGRAEQTFRTFDRMTRELRETRAQLRETERATAFRDVARNLAHELKNPLFPIRTSIETLRKTRERMPEAFDEAFEETTRVVLEEVQRLERIVREFGEFARLPQPVFSRIDLAGLTDDVAALYGGEPGVRLHTHGTREPVYVRADRELLMQVLVNLVLNAQQAVPPGGHVELSVEHGSGTARVHVDDDGDGVKSEARSQIFEPYFSTKREGSGLGLAIARRIAEEHGGRLEVTDGALGGARFTLSLTEDETHAE